MNKIDFYASQVQYYDHMIPIWEQLHENAKGVFYVSSEVKALRPHSETKTDKPKGNLTLVAGWGDYRMIKGDIIYMEHGIGHTYVNDKGGIHTGYAGSLQKDRVVLFLNQHKITQQANLKVYPNTKQATIGTPKMDKYETQKVKGRTVCFSFHWDCRVSPESRSAFYYYKDEIKKLMRTNKYNIVIHAHPRLFGTWQKELKKFFRRELQLHQIKFINDFDQVLELADVYVNDNSSTIFEFALLDKPVIVLNCPLYRKDCAPSIRFWNYIPGLQVDNPQKLDAAILRTLDNPNEFAQQRADMRKTLYPYWHKSSKRAAKIIEDFLQCK